MWEEDQVQAMLSILWIWKSNHRTIGNRQISTKYYTYFLLIDFGYGIFLMNILDLYYFKSFYLIIFILCVRPLKMWGIGISY